MSYLPSDIVQEIIMMQRPQYRYMSELKLLVDWYNSTDGLSICKLCSYLVNGYDSEDEDYDPDLCRLCNNYCGHRCIRDEIYESQLYD